MNPDIDAVLFDFAGVLSTTPMRLMAGRAAAFELSMDQFLPIALGPTDHDSDHPWHQVERGEMSMVDFIASAHRMASEAGLSGFPAPPTEAEILTEMQPVQEMVTLATDARASGYRTAIVSNNVKEWGAWRQTVGADSLVDVVIDSCEVGVRKPNPAIFELTLERLGGVAPARSLFLDDFEWNVRAAAGLGCQTIHVSDPIQAAEQARAVLALP